MYFQSQAYKSRKFRVELQCKEILELSILQEGYYHLVVGEKEENGITVSFQGWIDWLFWMSSFTHVVTWNGSRRELFYVLLCFLPLYMCNWYVALIYLGTASYEKKEYFGTDRCNWKQYANNKQKCSTTKTEVPYKPIIYWQ